MPATFHDRYCPIAGCNTLIGHGEPLTCVRHEGAPLGGCHDLDQRWGGRDPKRDGVKLCVLWPSCGCGKPRKGRS